jgi:DNA-binding NtrC family response regulator
VIIITGYATIDSAVRAVQSGAYDFLAKPFALGQLEILLARIRDRMALESENRDLTRQIDDDRPARGAAPSMHDRVRLLEDRIAALERIVLSEPRR